MDEAAFLAEIQAAPDDDAPRLIFADWLEERGSPRADFIRAQCAAARLPEWDVRRRPLERQAADLWTVHGAQWQAALPELPGATWGAFECGMPCEVVVKDLRAFARHADVAASVAPRVQFRFRTVREDELATDLEWLRHAGGLVVFLSTPGVVAAMLTRCRSDRLKNLVVESPVITSRSWRPVADALAALHLHALTVIDAEEFGFFHRVEGLRGLRLQGGNCSHADLMELANHLGFEPLQQLCLERVLSPRALEVLATGRAIQGLRSLRLTFHQDLDDLGWPDRQNVEWLLAAHRLPDLVDLHLNHAGLIDEDIARLAHGAGLKQLRSLSLTDNEIHVRGIEALAASPLFKQLESLDLSGNGLGKAGLQALLKSPYLGQLRFLGLERVQLAEAEALELAGRVSDECELSVAGNALSTATLQRVRYR